MKYSFVLRIFLVWISLVWILDAAKPGGVNGSKMWLRADRGVTLVPNILWEDQSGSGANDASQSNSTYKPTYESVTGNFNPAFYFTDHFLDVDYASELNGADLSVFTVVMSDGSSGWRSPWTTRDDPPGTATRGHILYLRNDNNKYDYWNGSPSSWKTLHTNVLPSNHFEMVTTTSDDAGGSRIDKAVYIQGKSIVTASNIDFLANKTKPFRIGKGATENTSGNYPWHGYIAETIVFDKTVTDAQRNRVESYLAIKYGMTLDQSGGGQNYHDSNGGSAIWSASSNSGYGHDIAGLARDTGSNGSDLDQRVSHSINPDAVVVMSTTADFSSENLDGSRPQLSGNNRRFLIWSNDNAGHGWTEAGAPSGGKILERKWKVQKAGNNQHSVNLQVDVDDSDFDIDSFSGDLFFVQGDDLSTATPMRMTNDGGGKWHIEDIEFNNKDFFSFVIPAPVPASAHMVINEVLYRQKTGGHTNEEFIEFYVAQAGTLDGLLFSDQDGATHQYKFSNVSVSEGDYVVLYVGDGTNTTGDTGSNVHKFYMGRTEILNNGGDDIVLMQRSATDVSKLDGTYIFYVPVDYVSYDDGNAVDSIPETTQDPTISWDVNITVPSNMPKLKSISLTNNGVDNNHASDWEVTTSGTAPGLMTIDHNNDSSGGTPFICSDGYNNNAMPDMHITKTSIVISDPVNITSNPKRIPGAIVRYCFTVDNTGGGDADNATIHDSLTGNGKDNLTYQESGYTIQNIAVACDCAALTNASSGSISGTDVTINLGTITGTNDTTHSRGCAYIETEIK